jgi:hypothetical protein
MKIDNQNNTYRIWLSRLVMTVVFALIILILVFIPWFDNAGSGIGKYHVIILVSVVYVAVNWINYMKRPYFVAFSDQGEMIILRYYPVSMFTNRKNSIEIPKKQFVKYELKPFFFKSQHYLILHQNFRGKVAKYPPISLSAMDRTDREKLLGSLNKYAKSKAPENQGP